MSEERLVAVALPLPLPTTFTYRVPELMALPERGARLLVPFGQRRVIGVVTGRAEPKAGLRLKEALELIDDVPLVTPTLLDLAAWAAEYYLAPPGECYRLAFPPAGVRASRAVARLEKGASAADDPVLEALAGGPVSVSTLARRLGRDPSARLLRLKEQGLVRLEQDLRAPGFRLIQVVALRDAQLEGRGAAQQEVLRRLRQSGGRARLAELVRDRPSLRGAVMGLVEKGTLSLVEEKENRKPAIAAGESAAVPELSADQRETTETLAA